MSIKAYEALKLAWIVKFFIKFSSKYFEIKLKRVSWFERRKINDSRSVNSVLIILETSKKFILKHKWAITKLRSTQSLTFRKN